MPDCLAEQHGKYLVIEGVRAYGHQVLASSTAYRREHGEAARATALGQAISYRFKRDGKGWRVFAELPEVITTDRRRGAIGVDLCGTWRWHRSGTLGGCPGHLRLRQSLIRRGGEPVRSARSSWLDFRQKKAVLEGESRKYSRMLSGSRRTSSPVATVGQAYMIGRVKFMERYGLTVHQAAALVLGSERIPRRWVTHPWRPPTVPVRKRVKHVWT